MPQIGALGTQIEVKNWNVSSKLSPITFDNSVNAAVLQCRTAVDLLFFADDNDQAEFFTVKSGTILSLNVAAANPDTKQIGWVKTNSGTAVLEGIGIY